MKGVLRVSLVVGREVKVEDAERELAHARELYERIKNECSAYGYSAYFDSVDLSAKGRP